MSEAWGKTTCLQLALEAKDMKFVSHGGIQVTTGGPASSNSRPGAGVEAQPPLSRGRPCSPGSGPREGADPASSSSLFMGKETDAK